jgi:hypothetical protein
MKQLAVEKYRSNQIDIWQGYAWRNRQIMLARLLEKAERKRQPRKYVNITPPFITDESPIPWETFTRQYSKPKNQ